MKCLAERLIPRHVLRVHQRITTGLDLIDTVVQMIRTGAARAHQLTPYGGVGGHQKIDRSLDLGLLRLVIELHHEVTLVPHHTPHGQALRPGIVSQPGSLVGRATAPGEADVYIDQHLTNAGLGRGIDRHLGVDSDGDARLILHKRHGREPPRIDRLIREEQVVTEARFHHAEDLSWRGTRERAMAVTHLFGGE